MSGLAHTNIYVGIDVGTSGIRAFAINDQEDVLCQRQQDLPPPPRHGVAIEQDPALWWATCHTLLKALLRDIDDAQAVRAIAIDGTSGTVLLTDAKGQPLTPALMYNDARANEQLTRIRAIAPPDSPATAISAGLPKILWLADQARDRPVAHIMHQADWLAMQLSHRAGISDSNNCLKSGYDPLQRCWPEWIQQLVPLTWFPRVELPGQPVGPIDPGVARDLGLAGNVLIVSGTTDSTAAIIATGAQQVGDAITSLGSTLVCKIISDKPVFASEYGVYSQPFGDNWLVGGGSNSGGAVLRQYFTDTQMQHMSEKLDPSQSTGLDYYPLPGVGERFPVNDPSMPPRLTPRPEDDVQFFQGLLEGIARIEYNGYRLLHELGAPYPASVRSVGGGAANRAWTLIRSRLLQTTLFDVEHSEAAYGSALLAKQGFTTWHNPTTP